MSATVYTTAGGRRFHFARTCRALESGRALSDMDCGCDEFCYHRLPTTHLPRKRTPEDAAHAGYTACRVCVPPALALPATGRTYGHEPFEYDGVLICRRCFTSRCLRFVQWDGTRTVREERRPVFWPCTSAVILGLIPRCPDCGWGIDVPGGRKCGSCDHSDRLDALGAAL